MKTEFSIKIEEHQAVLVNAGSDIPVVESLGKIIIRATIECDGKRCVFESPMGLPESDIVSGIMSAISNSMLMRWWQLKSLETEKKGA